MSDPIEPISEKTPHEHEVLPAPTEGYSAEELGDPAFCISAALEREFVGRTDYEGEKALDKALETAEKVMPEVKSAYQPSGKTTAGAIISMFIVAPFILMFLLVICGGICFGLYFLFSKVTGTGGSTGTSRGLGLLSIIVDFALVALMIFVPTWCFGILSRLLKNRNAKVPAILTALVNFIVAIVLFVPIWGGATLAPTDLTFLFIPIKWVLIIVGGLVVPLVSAAAVKDKIVGQKYCEETGRFLKPFVRFQVLFDFSENALALLKRDEYELVAHLPLADDGAKKARHYSEIVLWGHDEAETFFLEMKAFFHSKSKPQKKLALENPKDESKNWLIFSKRLGRNEGIVELWKTNPPDTRLTQD